jgi:hypothetical protein
LTVVFNVRGLSSDEFFAESRARAGRFTELQSTLTRAASHVVLPFTFATRARSPVDVVRSAFGKRALSTRAIGLAHVAADAHSIVAADADAVVVDVALLVSSTRCSLCSVSWRPLSARARPSRWLSARSTPMRPPLACAVAKSMMPAD